MAAKLDNIDIAAAIDNALDVLGHDMKRVLVFHLKDIHGFVVGRDSSIVYLRKALSNVVGRLGAELLLERVFVELDKLAEVRNAA